MSLLGLHNATLHDMLTWRSMIVPSDTTILDGIYSHNKWIYVLFLLLLSLSLLRANLWTECFLSDELDLC